MTQIFHRGLLLALKLGALLASTVVVSAFALWRWSIDDPHSIGSPPTQPLPFSHVHHVGEDGIDCRYCHSGVEDSQFAGLPSTQVCMSCHSQLFRDAPLLAILHAQLVNGNRLHWVRVNSVPDFVYFDHHAHVAHGVPCTACHGRVDAMPLMSRTRTLDMRWCLDCHRNPAPQLVASDTVFEADARPAAEPAAQQSLMAHYGLAGRADLTDCSTCHR